MGGDIDDYYLNKFINEISIHTSAWEVTRKTADKGGQKYDFNPHLRMGGD